MTELEKQLLTALEQLHQDYSQRLDEWESAFAEWQKMSGLMQRENAALNERVTRLSQQVANLIDRNLNPQKTKKAPQNGYFFNTPCAPYERKRLLNRMTLIDTGYEWRFFAPFPVKWTQLPLCDSQPHTCCRASRSCIRTSSASR
ncbi:TPA: MbeD family mobilization/exclusion protein [Salmonella enterica]